MEGNRYVAKRITDPMQVVDNTGEIARRLLSINASAPGVIRMHVNPIKLPVIISVLGHLGRKKPFFTSATQFVVDCVLAYEAALVRILPSTFLAGPLDQAGHTLLWGGSGRFAGRVGVLAPALYFEGEARTLSLIINIAPVFSQISDLLQSPEERPDLVL